MNPEVNGLIEQFKSIKKHIQNRTFDHSDTIIEKFNEAAYNFNSIKEKYKINSIILFEYGVSRYDESTLIKISIDCDKVLGVLETLNTSLPKEELDKLTSLREELIDISEHLPEINFEKNMSEAIKEYENKHYLASALISSRVIVGTLEKIPGKTDEDRIKFLQEKGFIKEKELDSKKSLTKAIREARNMFSHNVSIFPNPSDTITLLGDSVKLLNILSRIK